MAHREGVLGTTTSLTWTIFWDARIWQNFEKAKNGDFVTTRSCHMIALWFWNFMYISISPISTPYFNPIQKSFSPDPFLKLPKTSIFGSKGTNPWKIGGILGKFHLSKIPNMGGVYGGNDVFWGFEGCQFDFGHFWKFLKKFLKKRFFRPGEMVPSPAGFSCGYTFKNLHFSKNLKPPKSCRNKPNLGVWV